MTEPPRLMTLEEVTKWLNCSRATVFRRIAAGKLKAISDGPGSRTLFDPRDVEEYLEAQKTRRAA